MGRSLTGLEAQFGRYVFLKKLAEGGMAEIFLAQRRSFAGFGRFVVIKRLLPEHRGQLVYERLFLEEARIVASLKHPNVVNTYDLGKFDDAYFMVMEYIMTPKMGLSTKVNLKMIKNVVMELNCGLMAKFMKVNGQIT